MLVLCLSRTRMFVAGLFLLPVLLAMQWLFAASAVAMETQDLNQGWRVRMLSAHPQFPAPAAASEWRPARVPGHVQTDLIEQGVLADPFVGLNERAAQWVGLADWEYEQRFDVAPHILKNPRTELVFAGLDTLAEVELNGRRILTADNAFRNWRVPVAQLLRIKGNLLRVRLRSPITALAPVIEAMPHKLAGNYASPFGDEPQGGLVGNFVRKPGYHFGWDWGPRLVAVGIWQGVRLESWRHLRLEQVQVKQKAITAQAADLSIAVTLDAVQDGDAQLRIQVQAPDGKILPAIQERIALKKGANTREFDLRIAEPRRWFPVGEGPQDRYTFSVAVMAGETPANERVTWEKRIGLRSVRLLRERDLQGQGFAFEVNGRKVFAKGANAIPFDMFPNRISDAQIEHILRMARDANMNMLRLWGGGYYERDRFYELADELGLMIWQDFMFGGGVVPAQDARFRANVIAEARDQLRRLRHHASIVLWCGNNEMETAWKDWGIGRTLREENTAFAEKVWQGYVQLFGNDLREMVALESPETPYWSSSPGNDLADKANDSLNGDKHYWDVWAGSKPTTLYQQETPRFMSEYGVQAWPAPATVDAFAAPDTQQIDHEVIRQHQKFMAGKGNERLLHYLTREWRAPRDFRDFVYLSQLFQADSLRRAGLHHRASQPFTMGSLYWQLNDVWPGASWSAIDVYARPKMLWYATRAMFAPTALSSKLDAGVLRAALIRDTPRKENGQWSVRLLDYAGKEKARHAQTLQLDAQTVVALPALPVDAWLRVHAPEDHVLQLRWQRAASDESVTQLVWLTDNGKLRLPTPQLEMRFSETPDGAQLSLHSPQLVRGLWLDTARGAPVATFSDNGFDLLPGETRTIAIRTPQSLASLRAALTWWSYRND